MISSGSFCLSKSLKRVQCHVAPLDVSNHFPLRINFEQNSVRKEDRYLCQGFTPHLQIAKANRTHHTIPYHTTPHHTIPYHTSLRAAPSLPKAFRPPLQDCALISEHCAYCATLWLKAAHQSYSELVIFLSLSPCKTSSPPGRLGCSV